MWLHPVGPFSDRSPREKEELMSEQPSAEERARKVRMDAELARALTQQPAPARAPAPAFPAGWYDRPDMPNTRGYWDGRGWTDHLAPQAPREPDHGGLVFAGVVTAALLPIVGFVIGVVLLGKKPGAGVGVLILSVLAFVFWYNQLTPDAPVYYYKEGY